MTKIHPTQDKIHHDLLNEEFKLGVLDERTERIGWQYFVFRVSSISQKQIERIESKSALKFSGAIPTEHGNLTVVFNLRD